MNPLLTLIVPTWNRREHLQELLALLLPELDRQPDIDILVSNNASPDDTATYLDGLPAHPRLRVVHQAVNYGAIIHAAWLYGQARGRFLWMICDDDLVAPDAVSFVCTMLRTHPELGWIHLPHQYLSNTGNPVLSRMPPREEWFAKGRQAFAPYIPWVSFVTSNVLRTELLQRQLPRIQWGTDFWPMGLLMQAVGDEPASIPARYLITAGAEITWSDRRVLAMHCGFPEELLKSHILSKREKTACLRQWYRVMPNHLGRLLLLAPGLLGRILLFEPRLLGVLLRPSDLTKVFRPSAWHKLGRRLTHGRKAAEKLFHD